MRKPRKDALAIITVPAMPDEWSAWRFKGNELISPDRDRITPERLKGLLWRDAQERRLADIRARNQAKTAGHRGQVTVIRMPCADWHRERFGTIAG